MRTETFEGTVEEYQGKKLDKAITFSGSVDVPETITEAKERGFWPSESEMLKAVVTKIVAGAKSSEYQKNTKSLKEAYEASDDFKRNNLVKAAIAAGYSQVEAEAFAAGKLG
jgi:hypothetical protein